MKFVNYLMVMLMVVVMVGCSSPTKKIKRIELGMTPEEVRDEMGDPYTIRAAKIFDDGQSTQIWEYQPMYLAINPKVFWIYFENDKVVQWGEPGDFSGKAGKNVPVEEYKAFKKAK